MILTCLMLLVLALHVLLLGCLLHQLRHPYRFPRWQWGWGWMLFALALLLERRVYEYFWLTPNVRQVLVALGIAGSLCASLWHLTRIFERDMVLPTPSVSAQITIDPFSVIIAWDEAACRLFGWTAQEAIGLTLMQTIIPPLDWEAHRAGLARYLALDTNTRQLRRSYAMTARDKEGREIPVSLQITAVVTPMGETHFVAAIRALEAV